MYDEHDQQYQERAANWAATLVRGMYLRVLAHTYVDRNYHRKERGPSRHRQEMKLQDRPSGPETIAVTPSPDAGGVQNDMEPLMSLAGQGVERGAPH
jgi:hypothetical protein